MSPVHNTTAIVAFEFAVKRDSVTVLQRLYSWRQINIVCHQHSPPGRQLQNKLLMAAALIVVRQYSQHHATALHLLPRQPMFVGPACVGRVDKDNWSGRISYLRLIVNDSRCCKDN